MTHDIEQSALQDQELHNMTPPAVAPKEESLKKEMPHWLEVFILVAGELAFALLALPFYYFFVLPKYEQGAFPGFVPALAPSANPVLAMLTALVVFAIGVGLVFLIVKLFGPEHFTIPELEDLIARCSVLDFVLIYVAAGVGEEMLFRVVIQDLWGLLPATLLFTVFHAAYWKKPVMLADVFVVGLLLGLLYTYTQSFWLCAAVHAAYNLIISILAKAGIIPLGGESMKY